MSSTKAAKRRGRDEMSTAAGQADEEETTTVVAKGGAAAAGAGTAGADVSSSSSSSKSKDGNTKKARSKTQSSKQMDEDEEDDGDMDEEEAEQKEEMKDATEEEIEAGAKEMAEAPNFPALSASELEGNQNSYRRINVPPNRFTPLKNAWMEIYKPIVEHMKLNIRFNPKKKCVELKSSKETESAGSVQKAADFIRAFMLGFEVRDALALLRLEDLYLDSFELKDVKILHGEHLSRAIGRVAGQGGKTKYTIENATRTRIVLADTHVHILGSFANIRLAKDAIVRLIIGSPPGKVYTQMKNVAARQKTRF